MRATSLTKNRKDAHIRICLEESTQFSHTAGFEAWQLPHHCLPEIDLQDVCLSTNFLGHPLHLPIMIGCMTGGTPQAKLFNQRFASAAEAFGMPLGLGSMRVLLEDKSTLPTFAFRKRFPRIPCIMANLGAVQLNKGVTPNDCARIVKQVEADILVLHLNPLQEALQKEGDTNWQGLFKKIEQVVRHLDVPVIAKEVGWGITPFFAKRLRDIGIRAIDIAGTGGTSWSQVEAHRTSCTFQKKLAHSFHHWGAPTAQLLTEVRQALPHTPLIASGGIQNGICAAKALAMGADLVSMAGPFLKAACHSEEDLYEAIKLCQEQLRIALFCTGSQDIDSLRLKKPLKKAPA